jgi:hypothetical protein
VSKINDGGPAFARDTHMDKEIGLYVRQEGMSLRDYFAAAALQGILARGQTLSSKKDEGIEAFQYSDAMLKAREAKP